MSSGAWLERREEDGGMVQTGPEGGRFRQTEGCGVRVRVPVPESGPRHNDGVLRPQDVPVLRGAETRGRVPEAQERDAGGQRQVQMFHPEPEDRRRSSAASR